MKFKILNRDSRFLSVEIDGEVFENKGWDCGASRSVYLFENFVVKIDDDPDDRQGLCEIEFYLERLEDEDKEFFPKLIDWGYFEGVPFVVQERVEIFESLPPTDRQAEIVFNLSKKYELEDIFMVGAENFCGEPALFNHNVTPVVGTDSVKIWDIGIWA